MASLSLFAELRDVMGRSEAACLALAATTGSHIASDEKKRFRRTAIELIGEARILRTNLIVEATCRINMTAQQADVQKGHVGRKQLRPTLHIICRTRVERSSRSFLALKKRREQVSPHSFR